MKLSARAILLLSAFIPLAIGATAIWFLTYSAVRLRSNAELESRTQRLAEALAAQLDAQLVGASQIARSMALVVAEAPSLSSEELGRILKASVVQCDVIYGACIAFEPNAFEPNAFEPGRRLFAPYASRRRDAVSVIDIAAQSYDYTTDEWAWYAVPRSTKAVAWSEPYFDTGAGEALMSTFSAPIIREGVFIGVATVDIAVDELRARLWIDQYESGSFLLLSPSGSVVASPLRSVAPRTTIATLAEERGRADLRRLGALAAAGRRGIMRMPGLDQDAPEWFVYTRVPTANWSLVVMVPESQALADESQQMAFTAPSLVAAGSAVLGCVWIAARRVTRRDESTDARGDDDGPRTRRMTGSWLRGSELGGGALGPDATSTTPSTAPDAQAPARKSRGVRPGRASGA